MFDYQALKKYLFKIDPEKTHKITEYALRTVKYLPICFDFLKRKNFIINNRLKQNIFGKDFLNPVGLAAGFDKNDFQYCTADNFKTYLTKNLPRFGSFPSCEFMCNCRSKWGFRNYSYKYKR